MAEMVIAEIAEHQDISGMWRSVYHYTSSQKPGEFTSEYDVRIHSVGNELVIQSVANAEKSYILLRMTLDGRIATGTWHEETSPTGDYQGEVRYGALQLVLDEAGNVWRGKWVGFSRTMEVYAGNWVITRK